ncbi:hypothetical protein U14_02406 [Candidatus Moduliflexus flocculans]|uniref:Multidrug-efflux transporter n=1 Tax=Candidatus Moduliflexus flocculans TaxID=1499966 RepID=A0A081BL98_9BACT|nr:hypothetical protein U14_02406 [Candidatus Moduliflexus flocculans]
MTTKELLKRILMIALPSSAQFLVQYLQMSTDMAFVGHYNTLGLSAIQNARVSYFFFLSFFMSFSTGTNILIAQTLGAKQPERAGRIGETSLCYNQIIGLIYLALWQIFGRTVLTILGAQGEILELSNTYIRILSLQFLFDGMVLTAGAIFQGQGNTLPITIASVIRAGVNIPLDYCMIFGKWGFPEMGVAGAAWATFISSAIGGAAILWMVARNSGVPLTWRGIFDPAMALYSKVVKIGVPAGLEMMIWSAGNTVMVGFLNEIDAEATGFFGITNTVKMFNFSIYFGLGVATISLVGRAVGAKDLLLAKRVGATTLALSLGICIVVGAFFCLFPDPILGLFLNDPERIRALRPLMYVVALMLFPQALNVIGGNSIRARGDTKWMLKTQIIGTLIIIPLSYVAVFPLRTGLFGLLWIIFFDELWRGLANYFRLRWYFKREKQQQAMPAAIAIEMPLS